MYSVYVTDYTYHPDLPVVQANWCSPALSGRVLKVEMWLEANNFARNMLPGQFYSMRNLRMFLSNGGQVEGSFQEVQKLHQLTEEEDIEDEKFQALLQCVSLSLYGVSPLLDVMTFSGVRKSLKLHVVPIFELPSGANSFRMA